MRLNSCWALPALYTENGIVPHDAAIANLARRDFGLRLAVDLNEQWTPEGTTVVGGGLTYRQYADALVQHVIPLDPLCLNPMHLGNSVGHNYNGSNGGPGPLTNINTVRVRTRAALGYFISRGVDVSSVQPGNELDYCPPYYNGDEWDFWMGQVLKIHEVVAQEARDALPGVRLISGGHHLTERHGGVLTVNEHLRREGWFSAYGAHAAKHCNAQPIHEWTGEIAAWKAAYNIPVEITEDRSDVSNPDLTARAAAARGVGAKSYCTLEVRRDCDADRERHGPPNGPNKWGVNSKRDTEDGSAWTCKYRQAPGPLWADVTKAALENGADFNPSDDLPMGDGGPVDPPVDPPTDPPTVPMLEQAWDAYCWLRKEHDAHHGHDMTVSVYKADAEAREEFDRMVDRLGKHYREGGS